MLGRHRTASFQSSPESVPGLSGTWLAPHSSCCRPFRLTQRDWAFWRWAGARCWVPSPCLLECLVENNLFIVIFWEFFSFVTEISGYCICLQFLTLLKAIREDKASSWFGCLVEQDSGFLPGHLFLKVTPNLYWERIRVFPSLCGNLWSKLLLCFTSVSLWTWWNRLLRNTLEGIWTVASHLFFPVVGLQGFEIA